MTIPVDLLFATSTTSSRTLSLVLAIGAAIVALTIAILTWTRWGHARPIAKCAALSLFAHVLLIGYLASTYVFFSQKNLQQGEAIAVTLLDEEFTEQAPDEGREQALLPNEQPIEVKTPETTKIAPPELLKSPEPTPPPTTPPETAQPTEKSDVASDATPSPMEIASVDPPAPMPQPMPEPIASVPAPERSNAPTTPVAAAATIPRRLGDGEEVPAILRGRVGDRLELAQRHGGTASTEAAVAAAIEWLAKNQEPDGRWNAAAHGAGKEAQILGHDRGGAGRRADMGITGLALLAILGTGETHLSGAHRENVQHGLEFLLSNQGADGNLCGDAEIFARMYCHAIATLAMSEAFALSGDKRLQDGVRRAIEYTIKAQHSGGGWRYQPGDEGDMSLFGWQVLSLKSAEAAGVSIPTLTKTRMRRFLTSCSKGRELGLASYRPLAEDRATRPMTAEAYVCRAFLGDDPSPAARHEAAQFLLVGPPTKRDFNLYYWYYGTLAMFQHQGPEWDSWNRSLQQSLLSLQRTDGRFAGSWDADPVWGNYGGRVFSTALAALSLEVYYRYLPMYGGQALDETRLTELPGSPSRPR